MSALGAVPVEDRPTLAVVGATGAVGTVMLEVLTGREDVWGEIRLIASARSAGRRLRVRGEEVVVQALTPEVFDGVDVAMFDVPDEVSSAWGPIAVEQGAVVVDNSNAFRMDVDVPLVVPEVNPSAVRYRPRGIVASANCTTLSMIVAVAALHREYGLAGLVCSSYQAVSGAGQAGVDTLHDQLQKVAGNRELGSRPGDVRQLIGDDLGPFPAPIAMNVIPWAGSLREAGHTSEEMKVRDETRKILGLPHLPVAVTCVRVPVVTTHSVAVHATFEREVELEHARAILRDAPGVVLDDDPENGEFPDPDRRGRYRPDVGRTRAPVDRRPAVAGLLHVRRQPAKRRRTEHGAGRGVDRRGPVVRRSLIDT